jgi:hypothetical protein
MSDSNTYQNTRNLFGQPCMFKAKDEPKPQEGCIKGEPDLEKNYEIINPKIITLSNIPERSSHLVETAKTKVNTLEMKHIEGGWPESVVMLKDPSEQEREIRVWKRKEEKNNEDFPRKVKELINQTTRIINQNLRIDVYEDYFEDSKQEAVEDNFSAKAKSVFKDQCPYKRTINKIAIYHEEDLTKNVKLGRFAVAYKLCKGEEVPPTEKLPVSIILKFLVLCLGY